jgi:Ca2+-binding RTX toxin-like protein
MTAFSLFIEFDSQGLEALLEADQTVTIVQAVEIGAPVVWVSFEPFSVNEVAWETDQYSVYASTTFIQNGALIFTRWTQSAAGGNIYTLSNGLFDTGHPVLAATEFGVFNNDPDFRVGGVQMITSGLYQPVLVNGTPTAAPLNALAIPYQDEATFTPLHRVQVFTSSVQESGVVISSVITDALEVDLTQGSTRTIHYDDSTNQFRVGSLQATDGADVIGRGDNADSISALIGDDTVLGYGANDLLSGNQGNDLLLGNQGNDTIDGGTGANTVYGGQGNDSVGGQEGSELLFGNEGGDSVAGGEGGNTIVGGQDSADAADSITSGNGNDVIWGSGGNDTITAGDGLNLIFGGFGNDTIATGAGNDTIWGNEGNDTMAAGGGADRYVFGSASGNDQVNGFSFDEGDRLNLQGQTFNTGTSADGDVVLTLSGGGTIELNGVTPANFSPTFVL